MKKIISGKVVALIFFLLLIFLSFIFRFQILKGIGNFLVSEDLLEKADAIFVLGGDSYDRGNFAIKLFNEGYSSKIVCLGENIPSIFKAIGISYAESEVTKINIMSLPTLFQRKREKVIPDSSVIVLKKGTSTQEEIAAIIDYCKANNLEKVILISSKFHTRRVRLACKKKFREENLELIIAGAGSTIYPEEEWWKSEEGLIMVNNEYVKLVYYFLKY